MKIATYMRDDRVQIVLTPETDYEIKTLEYLHDKEKWITEIYKGQFTDVKGGWTMYSDMGYRGKDKDSTILVIDSKPTTKVTESEAGK